MKKYSKRWFGYRSNKRLILIVGCTILLALITFVGCANNDMLSDEETEVTYSDALKTLEDYGITGATTGDYINLTGNFYNAYLYSPEFESLVGEELLNLSLELPSQASDKKYIHWYFYTEKEGDCYSCANGDIWKNGDEMVFTRNEQSEEEEIIEEPEEIKDTKEDADTETEDVITPKREIENMDEDEVFMVMALSQRIIKNNLTYDSKKAKFSHQPENWYMSEQEGYYTVMTTFEAPNEYGTMQKAGAVVAFKVTSKSTDGWKYTDEDIHIEWKQ